MSNGKEYESKGIINFFGVVFGTEDFEGLFENAKKKFSGNVYKTNYDFINSLPFTLEETENGIVVFSRRDKIAFARPIVPIVESNNDEFEVVYLTEAEFNKIF